MAYSIDLAKSARRHLAAAERLDDSTAPPQHRRRDVAGYLYGVAAECALKEIMRQSGIYSTAGGARRDDPHYAHFPVLKTMLRDHIRGRRAGDLRKFADNDALMQDWNTDMRYAPAADIKSAWVDRWRDDARRLVAAMEEAG
ncbi:MAG: hypothetical protein IT384_27855 [Deltaproteobacteria bacterium]|nr:hypothetical protein [Deltaproteobacteria bacterium]